MAPTALFSSAAELEAAFGAGAELAGFAAVVVFGAAAAFVVGAAFVAFVAFVVFDVVAAFFVFAGAEVAAAVGAAAGAFVLALGFDVALVAAEVVLFEASDFEAALLFTPPWPLQAPLPPAEVVPSLHVT